MGRGVLAQRMRRRRSGESSTAVVVSHSWRWFRDYAEVCVAEEVGRVTARLVPRHDD